MTSASRSARSVSIPRWPATVVWLHWAGVLIVLVCVAAVLLRGEIDSRSLRATLLDLHRYGGMLLWLTAWARAAHRLRRRADRPDHGAGVAARFIAGAVHLALYALLLIVPVLGWALSNARGIDPHVLGIALPTFTARDLDLADTLQSIHSTAAWTLIALAALHALAALWHHLFLRDNVLRSMTTAPGPDHHLSSMGLHP